MTHKMTKVVLINEVIGALLSTDVQGETAQLNSDVNGFIANKYGIDVSAFDIEPVQNTDETVHLSLPYYAGLDSVSVTYLDDAAMNDISGTELVSAIIAIAAGVGATAIIGGTLGTIFGLGAAEQK